MFRFLLLVALINLSISANLNLFRIEEEWQNFKTTHNKKYLSNGHEAHARSTFETNLKKIWDHNARADAGLETYYKGVNKFTDMTLAEIRAMWFGSEIMRTRINSPSRASIEFNLNTDKKVPESVDWRKEGIVTPVRDQGPCGSCWAFSAVAALESAWAKKNGTLNVLSVQQVLDCDTDGVFGCRGGFIDKAYDYLIYEGGIDTEKSYPYEALKGDCWFTFTSVGAKMSSYGTIPQGNESALVAAVAETPVAVGIDAEEDFIAYSHGVFSTSTCDSTSINHGVTVVGYGTENGTDYYIVKNSWGSKWGEQGYVRMARGKNLCGITSMAYYPII